MEKVDDVVAEEGVLDVKNQTSLRGTEKSSVQSPLSLEKSGGVTETATDFSSLTPAKKDEQSYITHEIDIAELPEKYRNLSEFFNRMISSLRLLSLQQRSPTFQNVSTQVEVLTGRKFTQRHLAQIKYIVPEAIQIDKLLVHDLKTMCMKADVKITLHFDVVEDFQEHSKFMTLTSMFASRLMDFLRKHAKDCDIPEAILPDLFNQSSLTSNADIPMDLPTSHESKSLSLSHLCPSFSPRFSRQTASAEGKLDQFSVPLSTCSPCESECTLGQELYSKRVSPESSKSSVNLNNVEECQPIPGCSLVGNERTPMKILPESELIMLETPGQPTPKRSVPVTEDKHKKMTDQDSAVLNLTVKRSLNFSTLAGEEMSSDLVSGSVEHHDLERRTISKEDHVNADICPNEVQEKSCSLSKEEKMYQSHLSAVRQESFDLSDLVSLIHRIFQSVGCRSMTKVELVHKIIVNDFDIDENSDLEGKIELLEKLVPDWLSKKSAPTGDLLYSINKVLAPNSVCERVAGV